MKPLETDYTFSLIQSHFLLLLRTAAHCGQEILPLIGLDLQHEHNSPHNIVVCM